MPGTVRVKVQGLDGVRRYIRGLSPERSARARRILRNAFIDLGDLITSKAARDYIIRGSDDPNQPPHPSILTSRRGGAGLVGSIATDRGSGGDFSIASGSDLVYAAPHEFGSPSRNLVPRPFMQPALEDVIDNDLDRVLGRALDELIR